MKTLSLLLITFFFSFAAHSQDSASKTAVMTDEVKEILKKASEVIHTDKVKDVKSIVQKAKISIANMGINGTITIKLKGEKLRIDSQTASISEVSAFDGKTAWSENLSMGLRILKGAEKLTLLSETLPYAFTPEKFYDKIELEGKEKFNNVECYKIKFTKAGMDPVHEFIDSKTFLSHGEIRTIPSPMGKMKATTTYNEYKQHETGFKYPATMTQSMGPVKLEVKMLSITLNTPIDDKVFSAPPQ